MLPQLYLKISVFSNDFFISFLLIRLGLVIWGIADYSDSSFVLPVVGLLTPGFIAIYIYSTKRLVKLFWRTKESGSTLNMIKIFRVILLMAVARNRYEIRDLGTKLCVIQIVILLVIDCAGYLTDIR